MSYINKKIASWEVKYGQISISGKDNVIARDIFKNYFGKTFKLETFKGSFKEVNFNDKSSLTSLRLSCSEFFKNLNPNEIIYIHPKDADSVAITNNEPNTITSSQKVSEKISKFSENELLEIITSLTKENQQLRETNSSLF